MKRMTKVLLALGLVVALLGLTVGLTAAAGPTRGANGVSTWRGDPGHAGFGQDASLDAVARLLGMDQATLIQERQAGKSLTQIAAEKGVSKDRLVATILQARKAAMDRLVADGRLTQAQADTMYANMQTQVSAAVDQTAVGPGIGAGFGCGAGVGHGAGMGHHATGGAGGMMGVGRGMMGAGRGMMQATRTSW